MIDLITVRTYPSKILDSFITKPHFMEDENIVIGAKETADEVVEEIVTDLPEPEEQEKLEQEGE